MKIEIIRDGDGDHNLGKMFVDDKYFGETLEDEDRFLESDGVKIQKETAIPRGRYRIVLSESNRFGKVMPEVLDVPGFSGVRIHGGNTEKDTEGCPLLGTVRTGSGVANCGGINERLVQRIGEAIGANEDVWLEIT